MGLSLEQLWKDAPDDAIADAAAKLNTLNEEGRRVVLAEAKRRGLKLDAPGANGSTAGAPATGSKTSTTHVSVKAPTQPMTAKIWLMVAVVGVAVAALAMLV